MFTDEQLERYSYALLWGLKKMKKGEPFKEGDIINVNGSVAAMPLIHATYKTLLEEGYHPIVNLLKPPQFDKTFYKYARDYHLDWLPPWWKERYSITRGSIYIDAPESLTHLKDVDPEKQQRNAKSNKPYREFMDRQEEKGLFAWTICAYPTHAMAEAAGMTILEYAEQIVKACYLDEEDVLQAWEEANRMGEEIYNWLTELDIKSLHLESAGCDLNVNLGEKRLWLNGGGANVPSFEVFTSPDWRGANGVYYADQPSYHGGKLVDGVRLVFKDGEVVESSATAAADYLDKMVNMDEGSNKIGEFSLTDIRMSKIDKFMANTLFDENFGGAHGNSHIAIGGAYTETFAGGPDNLNDEVRKEFGFNESTLHWDLVNTEDKVVTATLKDNSKLVIYENGMFQN